MFQGACVSSGESEQSKINKIPAGSSEEPGIYSSEIQLCIPPPRMTNDTLRHMTAARFSGTQLSEQAHMAMHRCASTSLYVHCIMRLWLRQPLYDNVCVSRRMRIHCAGDTVHLSILCCVAQDSYEGSCAAI